MRYLLLIVLTGLGLNSVSAQFGVSSFVNFNRYLTKTVPVAADVGLETYTGSELALNYWFRLPKRRIEFQPTVYYAGTFEQEGANELGVQVKTNIYLFDLGTDCDCPTFGKQGPQLQKGFFLQLSPGIASYAPAVPESDRKTSLTLGAGVGIDFGLSNLVTLTPIASLRYLTGKVLEVPYIDENNVTVGTSELRLLTYQLGLQATFRLDKKRY